MHVCLHGVFWNGNFVFFLCIPYSVCMLGGLGATHTCFYRLWALVLLFEVKCAIVIVSIGLPY